MIYRTLGKTGYKVSAVIYGGIISMDVGQPASDRFVAQAIDAGVNYFDVAPSYGDAEEKLGNSLQPYRSKVYVACKTTRRTARDAETELRRSLQILHTDYFDNYQLHAMTTPADVESAFGPGGIMDLLVPLRQQGVLRCLGISAHSEQAALRCLDLYPFDTVLFPMNYQLDLGSRFGQQLAVRKSTDGFGLLGMKSLIERAWTGEDERKNSSYPKSWCKPFDADAPALRQAAMRYSLAMGSDVLVPPGNEECFDYMLASMEAVFNQQLSDADNRLLREHFEGVKDLPFLTDDQGW